MNLKSKCPPRPHCSVLAGHERRCGPVTHRPSRHHELSHRRAQQKRNQIKQTSRLAWMIINDHQWLSSYGLENNRALPWSLAAQLLRNQAFDEGGVPTNSPGTLCCRVWCKAFSYSTLGWNPATQEQAGSTMNFFEHSSNACGICGFPDNTALHTWQLAAKRCCPKFHSHSQRHVHSPLIVMSCVIMPASLSFSAFSPKGSCPQSNLQKGQGP